MIERVIDGHPVEFEFDQETGTWHFRIPDLDIDDDGQTSLEDAERVAAETIELALSEIGVSRAELDAAVAEIAAGRGYSADEVRLALGRPAKGDGC